MNFLKNLASDLIDDQEAFTNLTQVAVVDTSACTTVLAKRYAKDSIYTHCGPLLVAVNPYCTLEGLYDQAVLEEHMQLVPDAARQPHVFEMAARVYGQLMATGQDQAVIISGESGAGKTENAKLLLRFFAEAACSAGDGLHHRVMGTNPIMESFGCAQTVRNDNSSRFGKFVQLQFTASGRLAGAKLQTYLLEKSRVAQLSAGECCFHTFYETLEGLGAAQRQAYAAPDSWAHCAYLRGGGGATRDAAHDAAKFGRVREAFEHIGVSADQQADIDQLVLAILHLGNVEFTNGDEATVAEGRARASLDAACALLQTEPAKMVNGMCLRRMKAGSEWVTTSHTVGQASDVRHALAKQLYSALFEWLVGAMNGALHEHHTGLADDRLGPSMGCVDIFGFEIFESNSLEQVRMRLSRGT